MNTCYYFIPLFNALIGWLVTASLIRFLFHYIIPQKKEVITRHLFAALERELEESQGVFIAKVQEINLEEELNPILDKRLDSIIENLQTQIPMGEFLLKGSLIAKLKNRVRNEILQSLPEVKEILTRRMQTEFDIKSLVKEKIQALDLNQLELYIYQHARSDLNKMKGLGALVGLVIGLVELLFMLLIC